MVFADMQVVTKANHWGRVMAVPGNPPAEQLGPALQSIYQTHLEGFDRHRTNGPDPAHLTRCDAMVTLAHEVEHPREGQAGKGSFPNISLASHAKAKPDRSLDHSSVLVPLTYAKSTL